VLCLLVGATLVVSVLAGLRVVPWWSFAIPLALVGLFLVVARRQVRRASEDYWVEAGAAEPTSNVVRRNATRIEASHGAAKSVSTDRSRPGVDDDEPTVTLTAEELAAAAAGLDEERVMAVTVPTSDGGSLWDPLPVTVPTYVDKPVAKRSVRTIDLGADGVFSAGHDDAATKAMSQTCEAGGGESEGAAEAVETAKVVNG
jgi:hypothetical protein